MLDALILVAATTQEPPPITITEAQRMAIVETINSLRNELDEAEARALFWYLKQKECGSKTQI